MAAVVGCPGGRARGRGSVYVGVFAVSLDLGWEEVWEGVWARLCREGVAK